MTDNNKVNEVPDVEEAAKEVILNIIKEESEKSNVRQYTCINGFGYSQFERNIADRIIAWQKSQQGKEAVEFAEWKDKNYKLDVVRGYYSNFHDGSHGKSHIIPIFYTVSELYQLFKKQSK